MRRQPKSEIVIEPGGRGATYHRVDGFSVYQLSTYPRTSVLAGQQCRRFLDHYPTLEAAQLAHPTAVLIPGTTYQRPSLTHLSDDGDY